MAGRMYEIFIQIIFGWPAMLLSLGFAFAGILSKRWSLSLLSAILFVLPGWYLSHYTLVFALIPLCIFGSAFAIWNNKQALASLLIVPVFIFLIALAIVVLSQ
jgi:hypothetical protein